MIIQKQFKALLYLIKFSLANVLFNPQTPKTQEKSDLVGRPIVHKSAFKQATGEEILKVSALFKCETVILYYNSCPMNVPTVGSITTICKFLHKVGKLGYYCFLSTGSNNENSVSYKPNQSISYNLKLQLMGYRK